MVYGSGTIVSKTQPDTNQPMPSIYVTIHSLLSLVADLVRGPLHTQAKSRDHEIVRAQKKVFKGRPKTPPKSCGVVTNPQV